MDTAVVGAFLRQCLTIAGTWAVSKGWVDGGMLDQVVGAGESVLREGDHHVARLQGQRAVRPVDQLDLATRTLQQNFNVKYPKLDRIMYISVRDPDPELARTISNADPPSLRYSTSLP